MLSELIFQWSTDLGKPTYRSGTETRFIVILSDFFPNFLNSAGNYFKMAETSTTWRKVLFEKNGFPDNYTPEESFLAAIERNKNLRTYSKRECFQVKKINIWEKKNLNIFSKWLKGAAVVGREFSLLITFWALYIYLR